MKWPRPYRSFKAANTRRCELIAKMFDVIPVEDRSLRYDQNPGLEERHDALRQAALTPEEHAELQLLEKLTDDYLAEKFPRDTSRLDEQAKRLKAIAKRRGLELSDQ